MSSIKLSNFLFPITLWILWMNFCHGIISTTSLSSPCPDDLDLAKFPQVFVYNASGYDANIGTSPDYDTNGTVTFKTDETEGVVRLGLECRHHAPIKWVFDGDFISKGFREIHTNCSRTFPSNADFQRPETYAYLVRYELEFSNFDVIPFVFICQQVSSHICQRRAVVTNFDPTDQTFNAKVLSRTEEKSHPQLIDFDMKLEEQLIGTRNPNSKCIANLTISSDIDHIFYNWEPVEDYQGPYSVLDPQSFDNYFRFVDPQEEQCVFQAKEPEDLPCMQSDSKCGFVKHFGRPQVLYYVKGDHRRVLKGFFDVTEEENFHISWDPVDLLDFVFLKIVNDIDDTEPYAYIGQEVRVKCYTSPVFFSHGSVITWNSAQDTLEFASWQNEGIFISEIGTRNIEGTVHLTRSLLEGLDGPVEYVNISCHAPIWNSTEWVIKSQPLYLLESTDPFVRTSMVATKLEADDNGRIEYAISCEGFGVPLPTLQIIPPKQNLNFTSRYENGTNSSIILTLSFNRLENMDYEGFYNCVGTSLIGSQFQLYEFKFPSKGLSSFLKRILISFGSILLIFFIIVFALVGKLLKNKGDYQRKKSEAIKDFQQGFPNNATLSSFPGLEYDKDKYEVPIFQWDIAGTILGRGAFGTVQKGFVRSEIGKQLVAIKMVNSPKNVDDFRTTLMELSVMSYLGPHENILSLVAACVENIEKASLLIGVEYCMHGSLESYLRKRRPLFHNFVKDGKLTLGDGTSHGPYVNIIATANFSTLDLCKWSYQIANGMEFLESKKVLHSDLAARNVLITQDKIAKISDFGLSRALTQSSDYTKKTKVKLPWKWMALESLRHLQFSSKSDVWSFGVTLWEIFSLGDEPWPYESWTTEFVDQLEYGRRLDKPQYCTDNMYNGVILECWRNEPGDRIRFKTVRTYFEEVIVQLSSSIGSSDDFLAKF